MKDFSMFEQTLKIVETTGMHDMGFVPNVSRREFDERQTFACSAPSPAIEYLSLLIENMLLLRTNRTGRVYAGFGKLSQLEPVIERYLRIADVSERVYIFGEADWTPPRHPNMKLIETVASGHSSRERFIIADSSNLRVALVARSEEDSDARVIEERVCHAIKSSDPSVITQLAAFAEELIDTSLAA